MTIPKRVMIREVGAREGFQTLPHVVPTARKVALVEALARTGVPEIEVASFVRPDRVPTMADAEEIVRSLRPDPRVRYTALYLNIEGFRRAERFEVLANRGWIPIAASDAFLRANNNVSIEERLADIPEWIEAFRSEGKSLHGLMLSTAFGSNADGVIAPEDVIDLLDRVIDRITQTGDRLQEVCLADTEGCATPERVRRLVGMIRERHPEPAISLHFHDTRGCGVANVFAGLLEGVEIIDASVGGLGGCPFAAGAAGNVCTEDVVFLCHEMGIETGVDLDAYVDAAKLADSIVGEPLPGKVYRAIPMPRSMV